MWCRVVWATGKRDLTDNLNRKLSENTADAKRQHPVCRMLRQAFDVPDATEEPDIFRDLLKKLGDIPAAAAPPGPERKE